MNSGVLDEGEKFKVADELAREMVECLKTSGTKVFEMRIEEVRKMLERWGLHQSVDQELDQTGGQGENIIGPLSSSSDTDVDNERPISPPGSPEEAKNLNDQSHANISPQKEMTLDDQLKIPQHHHIPPSSDEEPSNDESSYSPEELENDRSEFLPDSLVVNRVPTRGRPKGSTLTSIGRIRQLPKPSLRKTKENFPPIADPLYEPWVTINGFILLQEHKQLILQGKCLTSDIIMAAYQLIKRRSPDTQGLDDTSSSLRSLQHTSAWRIDRFKFAT